MQVYELNTEHFACKYSNLFTLTNKFYFRSNFYLFGKHCMYNLPPEKTAV